jgi:ABC-type uncharacterized transport system substrate-binding protein
LRLGPPGFKILAILIDLFMLQNLQRVGLSLVLLGAGALTLLLSDLASRHRTQTAESGAPAQVPVALLKHASNSLLDEVERGVVEQLAAAGYRDGERIRLKRFSAEGDLPTANSIARQITDGSYPLVITISTLSLQCVANANRDGRAVHVFGSVTDPAGAGVGIRRMDSTDKPRWLAGFGTFQPVEEILREARRAWPGLKTVGVVWNPAERNSETCTLKAREVCRALGMQLVEATVDQSKDVREAAESLVARGAQAFWTGADVTVLNATATLCATALRARIPVISNTSGHVREGALFDLGANYLEVGHRLGGLAASILDGLDPATVKIVNFMPQRVMLNRQVLKKMRDPWRFPDDLVARAALILGADGRVERDVAPAGTGVACPPGVLAVQTQSQASRQFAPLTPAPLPQGERGAERGTRPALDAPRPLTRRWRIQEVSYSESVMTEDAMRGFRAGLKEAGLAVDRDFTLHTLSAQGDMATLPTLFDSARTAGMDLYMVYSTPTLQTALRKVRQAPLLFTVVADPFVAGAGKSDQEHLPNVTGVYTLGPYRELAELLRTHFPHIKRVGTLFCPAEANSVVNKELFVREATRCGLAVETVPANQPGELADAALSLCSRQLDAVTQVVDNLSVGGFPTIARAATQAHLPLFSCFSGAVQQGASLALARDYYDAGRETALKAARVMRGTSPAAIPFSPPSRSQIFVNLKNAERCRLKIPASLLRDAQTVADGTPR